MNNFKNGMVMRSSDSIFEELSLLPLPPPQFSIFPQKKDSSTRGPSFKV